MATDFDYELNPPKKVKQKSYATCWAAAFESILDAAAVSNKKTEDELVSDYGVAQAGGGIRPIDLGNVAKNFGFLFNIFVDKKDTVVFTDKFLIERLKQSGAVMAAAKISTSGPFPWYHAQVIWGVKYLGTSDIGSSNALLSTMNPADGKYALYPISYFTTNTPLFTCWKNVSAPSP
ncbi:papain-like cysteine protease family protein [Singulisphaera acidiphila]|uniref:Peptidase C1A papain C-terminal domain-containing protein n=1 Tax=Singulisphaera acidiphila (strain ATCC BAA-1392 / DSM 18658 / VKM B-2454 / MOB10) TaxID=886293 RepID=L0D7S8_SINAD|nr:papain-like cysteine protease family protein [Singulisphaera acidiphila]AGA25307.1 hypothetical protein Sinac_0902 [Singulisphaera acidiphila DSM 18658]